MAIKELEINGQVIPLVQNISELMNDANYATKQEVEETVDALTASDISYDGSELNENITDVKTALTFSLTKERTVTNLEGEIQLTTKITNVIIDNDNYVSDTYLNFSYHSQNECTIVIYNKSEKPIILPFNFSDIGNYKVVLVNGITSVTLLNGSSCEINMLFTNNECRMLILV